MRQVVPAGACQGDVPLPTLPGDQDHAAVLQCLTGGLVGAGLPNAGRAPVFHPLQHRELPRIDLPFQWPAFDSRLTYDGGMLSVPFVSGGWFETIRSNERRLTWAVNPFQPGCEIEELR